MVKRQRTTIILVALCAIIVLGVAITLIPWLQDHIAVVYNSLFNIKNTGISPSNESLTQEDIEKVSQAVIALQCYEPMDKYANPKQRIMAYIYGSGFLIDLSAIGYSNTSKPAIVTNAHVVPLKSLEQEIQFNHCTVILPNGKNFVQYSNGQKNDSTFVVSYSSNDVSYSNLQGYDVAAISRGFSSNSPSEQLAINRKYLLNSLVPGIMGCADSRPGKIVYIFGYPASGMSGDILYPDKGVFYSYTRNLIVSEGIVSSVDPKGKIFTTAKVDAGNSGGIAISKENGKLCILGIPTWVSQGEYENLGIINPLASLSGLTTQLDSM